MKCRVKLASSVDQKQRFAPLSVDTGRSHSKKCSPRSFWSSRKTLSKAKVKRNLLVILVVMLSRRLRSITNFFLANLAGADLCVALFCIYQNLLIYMIDSWILGNFLCKMYMFIQSLSNTASIFILVVICTERYFAILYPIKCKQILTANRLKIIICIVWTLCVLYSIPKLIFASAILNGNETVCILNRQLYNSKWFDMIHFGLFYVVPLGVMSTKIELVFSFENMKRSVSK
ncbi:hypothetical protein YQE_05821, partial [Dendroctonus ponderosae]